MCVCLMCLLFVSEGHTENNICMCVILSNVYIIIIIIIIIIIVVVFISHPFVILL